MKEEETGDIKLQLAASVLLALCLLTFSIMSFSPVANAQETNDQDEDGMDDTWEENHNLNSSDPADANLDPDQDGLINRQEFENDTDPASNDTDSDGMPDGWEVENGLDPLVDDAEGDADSDGLPNLREYEIPSDPNDHLSPPPKPPVDDDDDSDDTNVMADEGAMKSAGFLCVGFIFIIIVGTIILLVGMGIYSKIRKDRLLDHVTRVKIVEYLKENPGAYYSQMRKDLELAHGVLTHHLNILEQQELLFSKQDRSYRRFYLDGMYTKGPIVVGKQKEVLDMIRRYPGSSQSEIGRKLDLGRMIVSYHINQLEQLELIRKVKHGRENLIHPVGVSDVGTGSTCEAEDLISKGLYESEPRQPGLVEG